MAVLFYSLLGGIGIGWAYFARGEWLLNFSPRRDHLSYEITIVLVMLLLHSLFDILGPRKVPTIARFWNTLHTTLGPLRMSSILLLSLLSAYGEELFFRGALQPAIGYIGAPFLLAASPFPPQRNMLIWPLYALLMGAALGYLRILGGDIYSAVLLHFTANTISLYLLRKAV